MTVLHVKLPFRMGLLDIKANLKCYICIFSLFQVLHKNRNLKICKGCINGRGKEDGMNFDEAHIYILRDRNEDSRGGGCRGGGCRESTAEPGPDSNTISAWVEVQTYLSEPTIRHFSVLQSQPTQTALFGSHSN